MRKSEKSTNNHKSEQATSEKNPQRNLPRSKKWTSQMKEGSKSQISKHFL